MIKKGFTLAEVLITLAIIGVVAAMTIPSVIVRTNQQEYRTGAKKAYSSIVQAIKLVEAQDGITLEQAFESSEDEFLEALNKKLNIIKTETGPDGELVFYTADGFRYHMKDPGWFIVDVNGDKGPTNINMSQSEWAEATYNNEEDLDNPEWPDVRLTDMFEIFFEDDGGRNKVYPYTGSGEGESGGGGSIPEE